MTRPGIEPRSPGPLANTLTAGPVCLTFLHKLVEATQKSLRDIKILNPQIVTVLRKKTIPSNDVI